MYTSCFGSILMNQINTSRKKKHGGERIFITSIPVDSPPVGKGGWNKKDSIQRWVLGPGENMILAILCL